MEKSGYHGLKQCKSNADYWFCSIFNSDYEFLLSKIFYWFFIEFSKQHPKFINLSSYFQKNKKIFTLLYYMSKVKLSKVKFNSLRADQISLQVLLGKLDDPVPSWRRIPRRAGRVCSKMNRNVLYPTSRCFCRRPIRQKNCTEVF